MTTADSHVQTATVVSINISPGGIPKRPIPRGEVTEDGIAGDGHNHEKHTTPMQALNLLDLDDIEELARAGFDVYPGALGENITCSGFDIDALEVGTRLAFSGGVEIELTKRRKPCYVLDAIDPALKKAAIGHVGFYARILTSGTIEQGERLRVCDDS